MARSATQGLFYLKEHMPQRPLSGCQMQGCPATSYKHGYCTTHYPIMSQLKDKYRPKAYDRGYDYKWFSISAAYRKAHPFCFRCGRLAEMVDHRTPISLGGDNSEDNLQSMCRMCHAGKTEIDGSRRRIG